MNKRGYFRNFRCEVLSTNQINKMGAKEFSNKRSVELENYIRNRAWEEDLEGETRVYLVKDKFDSVVLFFSLKCGLLVGKDGYEGLSEEEKESVSTLFGLMRDKRAKDEIDNMKE